MSISSVKTGAVGVSLLAGNPYYDPAGTFLIQRVAGTGSSSTITFSNIPQNYKHLQIRSMGISTTTSPESGQGVYITFNGDSGSNYSRHALEGDGSTTFLTGVANSTIMYIRSQMVTAGGITAGVGITDIHDYASTTKNKTMRAFSGGDRNSTATVNCFVGLYSGLWMNTNAITSISLQAASGLFSTTSTFALYGMVG